MPIRPLPPLLVNQIAAGEVIERPASVLKELVENAIDAGAGRIDVAIEEGGKSLVRVTDDGAGIPFDELTLALAAHATSKITAAEDLDHIATMGFRGEALASIAAVSRLALVSRPRGEDRAGKVEAEGDTLTEPSPASGPPGTTITVRTLFFNTPARRKFLKTDQTETSRCVEMFERLALAHPEVGFTLRTERGVRTQLPPGQTPRARGLAVLGRDLEEGLLEIDAANPDTRMRIWGLAGRPELARGTSRHLRTWINGRPISDRTVNHAIVEAYRGLIAPGRTPTVLLFIEMDPADVDVNVHPTKAEVRFRRGNDVHRVVHAAVRDVLRAADLTPALELGRPGATPTPAFGAGVATQPAGGAAGGSGGGGGGVGVSRPDAGFAYRELKEAVPSVPAVLEAIEERAPEGLPTVRPATDVLQVHASYLVTQDAEGVVIIDQHALHERVMFERLKSRVEQGALESQRLLVPATVEVDGRQIETLQTLQPLFHRLGIEASPIGPAAVAVHAFPSLLFERRVEPAPFLRDLLARASAGDLPREPEAALHEVLDMMSCKAAIKAGDRLEPAEMAELLAAREAVERSSNCPHGRPTSLRISLRELERRFGR
ncbi:MAG: DNA mismatch repair endonuclease MutL [Phycisphaerales bacterium]|nr:DNA mismatch repair endonuclease MutL [Phycisphaerales bacterium]